MLQTPVINITKNDKPVRWVYSLNDEVKLKPGERADYKKGLGSWDVEDLKAVIEKDGLDKMIDMVDFNDDKILEDWLGNDSTPRKEYIMNNDFSISKL